LILYVNPTYKAITNWSLPIPIAKDASNLSYWTELSPKGFKNLLNCSNSGWEKLLSTHTTWVDYLPYCVSYTISWSLYWRFYCNTIKCLLTKIFDTGVRYHGLKELFVEGVMTVSFKLDPYGLPLVYVANFIPSTKL
jgi:hypothetical protein